ncbi:MAG TPA: Wzz/FepE/Etk N-terminal domain-containing protein [Bryobacteraceae bacterium]|nr:Wzz/FepE/Etk N-terminal domain-containing protein [Bryobacteraceae bacterium]
MLDSIAVPRRSYDFEDYIDILRRNFRWIIAPAFAGLVVAVVVAYSLPDVFISTATIRVTPQQISVDLVENLTSQDVADRINALALTIWSRATLTSLINTYGLYPKEMKSAPLQDVVETMKKDVIIQPAGGTTAGSRFLPTVQVGFRYHDKHVAQQVCQEIVSRLISQSSEQGAESQQQAHQFLSDEGQQAKHDLDDVERRLDEFRAKYAGHLPEEEANNMQAMNSLNNRMDGLTESANHNQEQRMMLEQEMRILKDRAASLRNMSQQSQVRNEKVADLDRQIATLKDSIDNMKQRYTEDYPDLQDAKAKLVYVQKQRDDAAKAKPQVVDASAEQSAALNAERQDVQNQIDRLNTQVKANQMDGQLIQKDVAATNSQIGVYQGRLGSSASEKEYDDLQRERDLLRQRYLEFQTKTARSSVSIDLEKRKQGETLELIDPASLPPSPVLPKRGTIVPIGAVIGLILGIVLVAVREVKDTSLKNLKDARLYTQLTILGSVPLLENDVVVQRRKQVMWVSWATATLAGCAIMAVSLARYYVGK